MLRMMVVVFGWLALFGIHAFASSGPSLGEAEQRLSNTIRVLSSDEFEGRSPGTPGEEKTVNFIASEMKKIGLQPGNPDDGTYFQEVPLLGVTMDYHASMTVGGSSEIALSPNKDTVIVSHHNLPQEQIKDSEVIFVGYGVVAPEYGWDDYKGVDVRGKTILMLVNDPQVVDSKDSSRLDDHLFDGKAMTYYGRFTYKYEIAEKKGAAAAIIIHDTLLAGYPFGVVANSWGRENFETKRADGYMSRPAAEGWITSDKAREILKAAGGYDLDSLKKSANSRDFHPIALKARFNATLKRTVREAASKNVVGILPGSDPKLKDRYLIYSAHWDHFGRDPKLTGDQVFHGALDNASGVAALLETARTFRTAKTPPKSNIVFLATTAEERGLLGAHYYVEHPLYPLAKTLADLNFDGVNPRGLTTDLELVERGYSDLPKHLRKIMKKRGRILAPEEHSERGMFFRTDQFEFTKGNVPSIWYFPGTHYIGKPPEYGAQKREEYVLHDYHKPTDVLKDDWELTGAVDDLGVFYELGNDIAQGRIHPKALKRF